MSEQNQVVPQAQRGQMVIYACGGAGINIGLNYEHYRDHKEPGMSDIDVVYLDTSTSNFKPIMMKEKIYLLEGEGIDGSGKERKQNAGPIMKRGKEMLQRHKPGYINVVLSSASGGSGAVIAASLTNELLAEDQLVINITIGVADSGAEIKNTLDTLKTFEGLVAATKKTVPVAYFENSKDHSMSDVDKEVIELITAVSLMFSRQNEGLDTRDLYNFLNVDRLTSYKAHAVGLEAYAGQLNQKDHTDTISVASAVVTKDNRGIDFILPYTTYGVMPADVGKEIAEQAPVHLVTKAFPFNDIAARLRSFLAEMEKAANANTAQSEVLKGDEKLEGGFMAL